MRFSNFLPIIAAILFANTAQAQDRLYKRDGSMDEVKIKEVGTRTVIYKKWNNQDGPDFVIPKSEISKIRFQNGDEESFDRYSRLRPIRGDRGSKSHDDSYGKNILSLAPVMMTNTSVTGIGLSYERVLDKNYIISFYLPVAYSFKRNNNNNYYSTGYTRRGDANVAWLYPGVKIYPTGSDGKVRYGVGASLAFGVGNNTLYRSTYDPTSSSYIETTTDANVFVMGLLVNNSLNIQPSPHIRIGLELGLGIPYYYEDGTNNNNTNVNYYDSSPYDNAPLVQFNFNVAYRF